MSKHTFIAKYLTLRTTEMAAVKAYYDGMLRNAIFPNTFSLAETALLWIREAEQGA